VGFGPAYPSRHGRRLLERTVSWRAHQGVRLEAAAEGSAHRRDSNAPRGSRSRRGYLQLWRTSRKRIACVAAILDRSPGFVRTRAEPHCSQPTQHQACIDAEWSDRREAQALRDLVEQVDSLEAWSPQAVAGPGCQPPLSEHLATLRQIREQDLEPDLRVEARASPGVAAERRVSVEDGDMRHGRKSKSKRFNGYKRHIAATSTAISFSRAPSRRRIVPKRKRPRAS